MNVSPSQPSEVVGQRSTGSLPASAITPHAGNLALTSGFGLTHARASPTEPMPAPGDAMRPDSYGMTEPSGTTSASEAARSRRIFVVDDDACVRQVMALVLRRAGYSVECADDGESAWEALATETFALLITDHEMPRLCGLDLIRRIRVAAIPLPAILISGNFPWSAPDLPALLPPGAALPKPFLRDELLKRVRLFLDPPDCGGRAPAPC